MLLPMDLESLRARACRLEREWRLRSLEEAEAWVRERGVVEVTPCCSLPSLHVAVHEPPYKPGSRRFGLYPATTWWWSFELATPHAGLHQLKLHRGKSVLVTGQVARLADPLARRALADAEEGALGELERQLVLHLRETGPGEVGDLRTELGVAAKPFRSARERLERVAALVSRPVELVPHGHSSVLQRWDQIFPDQSAGGLDELLVACARAAVLAPAQDVARWLSWPVPAGTIDRLVAAGRLRRVEDGMIAAVL
jgi:hypothetical protein